MSSIKNNNGILEIPNDPKYEPSSDSKGYGQHMFNKMKEYANRIAQIVFETNESDTYGEILIKSVRIALKIKSLGIQETDIVSLCTDTHKDTCLPYWGAVFAGVKIANLDPSISLNDLKHLTNIVKPKLIFCNPECVKNLEAVINDLNLDTTLVIFGETEKHIPFKECLEQQDGEEDFKPKTTEDIFDSQFILFSSGTTGLPKGICLTHYGILYNSLLLRNYFNMETALYYTSPYWVSYVLITTSIVLTGGKRILYRKFDEKSLLKTIQDYKVTFMFLPPTFTYTVTAYVATTTEISDTSSLHSLLVAGGKIGDDQLKKMRNVFPHSHITQLYGLTEITAAFSVFDSRIDQEFINSKPTSCGNMVSGIKCKIVDIETRKILGPNEPGELLIKSKQAMKEYYSNPKQTTEAFDEDGFLHTGDVLYYDEDYCFYVVDRIKEMFKYKSWHIVPAELENILLNHPAVKEVVVIGYPNDEDGDHPMAVIVPNSNAEISEKDIMQYFNDQVIDRKRLRGGIKFVKNLPKTTTGKYSRQMLRSMVIKNEINYL